MKPFDCDICGEKVKIQDALVRWHFDKKNKRVESFQIVHNITPCNFKGEDLYFNRELSLEYVYKNIPEFIFYINRFDVEKKEFKNFISRIEKDRSYIRRFNINKMEVKKLIIRLDGLGNE